MRKVPEILNDLDAIADELFDIDVTDPRWDVKVARRNELMIELAQAENPVQIQKEGIKTKKFTPFIRPT